MIDLRREQPEDAAAIRETLRAAFGRAAEADLVDALRDAGAEVFSLVAVEVPDTTPDEAPDGGAGRVVGYVLLTRVTVTADDGGQGSLLGLAPVAVAPRWQGQGIGMMLVEAALEQMRGGADTAVCVLGDPLFYSRFGFEPARLWGLRYEQPGHEEGFMAVELSAGGLAGIHGVVRFRPEFAGV